MGKLVEAVNPGYYGNVRIRPGTQFVMADAMFEKSTPVLDKDGKPVMDKDGEPEMKKEETIPSWVLLVEGGDDFEDPVFESEAEIQKKQSGKPKKRMAAKKQPDDHRQGGAFDIHPEDGVQVTGQVAPARPAASSFQDVAPASSAKDENKKGKSVI